MEKIAIVSSGGFAREVLTLINAINAKERRFDVVGFIDNDKGRIVHGLPIIGSDEEVNNTQEPLSVVIAVGEPRLKEKIRLKYTNPLISFPTLIHPAAIIADPDNIEIGQGCIICAITIMTTDIKIHDFVTLNLQCTVGHDTIINDYSAFMPSVNISGEVNIGKGVYVGTGAKIINQVEIGENTIVGAGAVVAKSLPANCTAVGVPAKPIKFH